MAGPQPPTPYFRERKSFKITELKAKGEGSFSATANAYGVVDSYNEIVDPGFFKRSLEQQGPERVILWQHCTMDPIGNGDHFETPNALRVDGQLTAGVQRADECYELLKKGVIKRMSIGFDVLRDYYDQETGIRHLAEGRLWESSFVTFAANDMALVDSVKSYGYSTYDLPLVIRGFSSLRDEVKQGRVLSQHNFDLIKQATSILQELLDSVTAAESSGKSTSTGGEGVKDSQPANEISDSERHSLLELAQELRVLAKRF